MIKNLVRFEELKTNIESYLRELGYEYTKMELEDNDLNYIIKFDAKEDESENDIIKVLKISKGLFFVALDDEPRLCFFSIISQIDKKEDINTYYKLVNDANSLISHGNFTIIQSENKIVYKISKDLDPDYKDLTKEMIKNIIDIFIESLYVLVLMLFAEREQDE